MFPYTERKENEKIEALKRELQSVTDEYLSRIEKEREIEKGKREFSWKNFTILVLGVTVPFLMYWLNHIIFPPTSMWSWNFWMK